MTDLSARTHSMTARTVPMSTDSNPIRAAVSRIRELDGDLTPRQREVREAGDRRTRDLPATGAYSLSPRP